MVIIGSIGNACLLGCGNPEKKADVEAVETLETSYDSTHWENTDVTFTNPRLDSLGWFRDTLCVVNGKTYCSATDEAYRGTAIFNDDTTFVIDPSLLIEPYTAGGKKLYNVSSVGKNMTVDLNNIKSLYALSTLTRMLPSFTRQRLDTVGDLKSYASYYLGIELPSASVKNSKAIREWLTSIISMPQITEDDIPYPFISTNHASSYGKEYKGNLYDDRQIAKYAASIYLDGQKEQYGDTDDRFNMFSVLDMHATICNDRFVTYKKFSFEYFGGMHGFYSQKLVSFDHVHQQEIDLYYLFKPQCIEDVLNVLIDEVGKSYRYRDKRPDPEVVKGVVENKDEDGNPTVGFTLPQPGLADDGLVFSFQPYELYCYAEGPFHFTVPYSRIKKYLTQRGLWCLGFSDTF